VAISDLVCYTQGSYNTVFRCQDGVHDISLKASGDRRLKKFSDKAPKYQRCSVLSIVREAVVIHALKDVQCVVAGVRPNRARVLGEAGACSMLVGLSHPRVEDAGSRTVHDTVAMCTRWCPDARPLDSNQHNVFVDLDVDARLQFALSALEGAATLHGLGVAHRDIKFDNVLLVRPTALGAQVWALFIDFAAACTSHMQPATKQSMDKEWRQALMHVPATDLAPIQQAAAIPAAATPAAKPSPPRSAPNTGVQSARIFRATTGLRASGPTPGASAAEPSEGSTPPLEPVLPCVHECCDTFTIQGFKGTPHWRGAETHYSQGPDYEFHRDTKALAVFVTCLAMGERFDRRIFHDDCTKQADRSTLGWLSTSFDESAGLAQGISPSLHWRQTALALTRAGLAYAFDRREPSGDLAPRVTREHALANVPPTWDRSDYTGKAIVHLLRGGGRPGAARQACKEAIKMLQLPPAPLSPFAEALPRP
jgi:serine/threonine protein kinase